jgi:hypothetical protein
MAIGTRRVVKKMAIDCKCPALFSVSSFQHQARLRVLPTIRERVVIRCARRAPWSAAAKLPLSLFGLFKAAALRPLSKGFAAAVTQIELIRARAMNRRLLRTETSSLPDYG